MVNHVPIVVISVEVSIVVHVDVSIWILVIETGIVYCRETERCRLSIESGLGDIWIRHWIQTHIVVGIVMVDHSIVRRQQIVVLHVLNIHIIRTGLGGG